MVSEEEFCKICNGELLDRPLHDKRNHFAIEHNGVYEFEYILNRSLTEEDSKSFSYFADHSYPWTLEEQTVWMRAHGYEVVWMRRVR